MSRSVLRVALAGVALVGTLAVAFVPNNVRAAGRVVSWGRPTVAIDRFRGLADQTLGIKSHWECITALDNPLDPFHMYTIPKCRLASARGYPAIWYLKSTHHV